MGFFFFHIWIIIQLSPRNYQSVITKNTLRGSLTHKFLFLSWNAQMSHNTQNGSFSDSPILVPNSSGKFITQVNI